jgi:hypothetical protein
MDLTSIVAVPWIVPVVCGCTVGIVAIICGVIGECFKSYTQTSLKRTMVENGYTAEQIVTVLNAKAPSGFASGTKKPSPAKGYA